MAARASSLQEQYDQETLSINKKNYERWDSINKKMDERWEFHKPLLARLYLEEKMNVSQIQWIMKEQYDFPAGYG